MSASGLLFFKVTQPGVVTPASHPSVWEMDAKGPVLPAVLSQHLTPPASFFPGYLLHCPSSHPSSTLAHTLQSYHVVFPGHCTVSSTRASPPKPLQPFFRHMHPQMRNRLSCFFLTLSKAEEIHSLLFPVFPFSSLEPMPPLPWCLLRRLAEQFSVFAPGTAGWCCVMAASASSSSLLSAKFRSGLPPFQCMTMPYDPHSGNSNPQASLPHFYILQSCGSHSCRIQV